jgi:uncharacterized protein (TIGR03435 family)
MLRSRISAFLAVVLVSGAATAVAPADASGVKNPAADVHITPTTMQPDSTSMDQGDDRWIARGYELKTLIAQIYDVDARRVDFPESSFAKGRYDVSLVSPNSADWTEMRETLLGALQKKFGLSVTRESRLIDVYVISAPNGAGPGLHAHLASSRPGKPVSLPAGWTEDGTIVEDGEEITFNGRGCTGVGSSNGIKVSAATIAGFGRTLEPDLDRLLVDETNLPGSYDFEIGKYATQTELFKLMRSELGLTVTPAQRKVTMLMVRPAKGT